MEQSPSWEAKKFSASQEFPRIWRTRRFITAFTRARHFVLVLSHISPAHAPIPFLEDPFYCCSLIYAWVFQVVSFPQVSPPKSCIHLSSPPYVFRAPPASFFLIWSPESYLVSSTDQQWFFFSFKLYKAFLKFVLIFFFFMAQPALVGQSLLIFDTSRLHSLDTQRSVGLLRTSYQYITEPSIWQHATLARDRHPWSRRDSNPQFQQASGLIRLT